METENKPLVTFALFAYNQAEYVVAALEGALSQEYSPLEIIVSDDCSTDDTFEIMNRVISAYRGPHKVSARRTEANRGPMLHVAEVAAIANGVFIVLAAADDISKPSRTSVTIDAMRATGAWGLCARFDRIDASGRLLEASVASDVLAGHGFRQFFHEEEGPVRIVHGCTSAYDMRAFSHLKLNAEDFILSEDGAMSVLLNLLGKEILNINESLVFYRESQTSLTNSGGRGKLTMAKIVDDERRIEWFAQAQANRCRLFLRMNEYLGPAQARRMRVDAVRAELARQIVRSNWSKMRFMDRVGFALTSRATWALPRLLGPKPFYFAKWLARRMSLSTGIAK